MITVVKSTADRIIRMRSTQATPLENPHIASPAPTKLQALTSDNANRHESATKSDKPARLVKATTNRELLGASKQKNGQHHPKGATIKSQLRLIDTS